MQTQPPPPSGLDGGHITARYNFPREFTGRGECVGILAFGGGLALSDVIRCLDRQTDAELDLRFENVTATNRPNLDSQHDFELALDLQVVARLAPAARIVVYFGSNDEQGWLDTVSAAIHDEVNRPSVLSISWGATEDWWKINSIERLNTLFAEAARLGITVCAASGDQGCAWDSDGYCRVTFPASSPFVLSCGGTCLTAQGVEVVWNARNAGASGGGISDRISRPLWQPPLSKIPFVDSPCRRNPDFDGRQLPDVVALAGNFCSVYLGGGYHNRNEGTSAAAPLWSALIARLNEGRRVQGQPRIGHLNPRLYLDRAIQQSLRPVDMGHNDPFGNRGYRACEGWNFCTGWGSPDGAKILQALAHGSAIQPHRKD